MKPHKLVDDRQALLNYFNERYAIILCWMSKTTASTRPVVVELESRKPMSFTDFRNRYINVRFEDRSSAADWWLKHRHRREAAFVEDLSNAG